MSENNRLQQVWSDNVVGNQIGGLTDGISPEVAEDLGYFPPEHYAQLKSNISKVPAPARVATPADKKDILTHTTATLIDPKPGPSVKITDYYQSLIRANEILADIMQKRGQLKQPHTFKQYGGPDEIRKRIADLEVDFTASFSMAFGEVAMLAAAKSDEEKAIIRFDRTKYKNSYVSRYLPQDGSDANQVAKIRKARNKSSQRYQKALDSYKRKERY